MHFILSTEDLQRPLEDFWSTFSAQLPPHWNSVLQILATLVSKLQTPQLSKTIGPCLISFFLCHGSEVACGRGSTHFLPFSQVSHSCAVVQYFEDSFFVSFVQFGIKLHCHEQKLRP